MIDRVVQRVQQIHDIVDFLPVVIAASGSSDIRDAHLPEDAFVGRHMGHGLHEQRDVAVTN